MDEIKGIARVKFHPGKVEEWKRLTEKAMSPVATTSWSSAGNPRSEKNPVSFRDH